MLAMRKIKLQTATCRRCSHTWVLRLPDPKNCPGCKSPYWRTKPGAPRGKASPKYGKSNGLKNPKISR